MYFEEWAGLESTPKAQYNVKDLWELAALLRDRAPYEPVVHRRMGPLFPQTVRTEEGQEE